MISIYYEIKANNVQVVISNDSIAYSPFPLHIPVIGSDSYLTFLLFSLF